MTPINRRLSSESTDEFDMNEATNLLDNHGGAQADPERLEEKPKYPKSVFFIISNEFCERFSYYGMRTILAIYLKNVLSYSDDDATVIYHVFTMLCYFFPIFGAMLADSLLGKFRTIFYISIIYAIGNVVISIASAKGAIDIPAREFSILGLILIAIGTGGIKPCVSAFGGDQFKLPQQEKQLQQFFSLFYFAINSGSLISTFITPILREDIQCLDQDSCYPLAFGVPAVLMVISILIFLFGKPLYIIKKPEGNIVLRVCSCICHALVRKVKTKSADEREHWLDYADDKYDKTLINDTKATLRVLFLYLPLPIFWALFDQQGSRWTFQATRMTGELGSWSLKPDQMQVINPLLILAFIPLFETVLYPLLAKCNLLKRPLQRLGVGGILAAIAFVISAIVELQLEDTYAVLPQSGEAQLRIFNGFNCEVNVNVENIISTDEQIIIKSLGFWSSGTLSSVSGNKSHNIEITDCDKNIIPAEIELSEGQATSYFITYNDNEKEDVALENLSSQKFDQIEKSEGGNPYLRIVYNFKNRNNNRTLILSEEEKSESFELDRLLYSSETKTIDALTYHMKLNNGDGTETTFDKDIQVKLGGVYTLILQENEVAKIDVKLLEITEPNSMHMLWLIPQYFVLTMGEVMFSITGLEFSFTQAPISMKSVLQAAWLLTVAFGNLIVVIVAEAKIFDSQAYEFFLFAGLMVVDMGVFAIMAMKYKYVEQLKEEDEENMKTDSLALKDKTINEKSGMDNTAYKNDD